MSSDQGAIPLVCDPDALPVAERESHQASAERLFAAVREKRELPDGYAFRLPAEAAMLRQAAAYIADERLCCPFFRFEIAIEPEGGLLWLRITGGAGVKEFLAAELK